MFLCYNLYFGRKGKKNDKNHKKRNQFYLSASAWARSIISSSESDELGIIISGIEQLHCTEA